MLVLEKRRSVIWPCGCRVVQGPSGHGGFAKRVYDDTKNDGGLLSLAVGVVMTAVLVFCFFEVLPHFPVGVSEVHFVLVILGTTLLPLFAIRLLAKRNVPAH